MIREIGKELQAQLRLKGCPFTVVDREQHKTTSWGRQRIVVEHDDDVGDQFGTAVSQSVNPKRPHVLTIGAKLTVYAQSRNDGAMEFEHRRLAYQAVTACVCAMDKVAAERKNSWRPGKGRFITPDDLARSEKFGGAIYELSFTYDRGVPDLTWAGEAQPEATLGAGTVRHTTKVSLAHGPDDDDDPNTPPATAETACGA